MALASSSLYPMPAPMPLIEAAIRVLQSVRVVSV
jgi:hypothetical protein